MLANHVSYNRVVQQTMTKSVLRYVAAAALVFAIVYTYHTLIRVNPTIVALTFLLAVLVVSARWGLRHAVFMAIVATLAFNYFFLPPVGTFNEPVAKHATPTSGVAMSNVYMISVSNCSPATTWPSF